MNAERRRREVQALGVGPQRNVITRFAPAPTGFLHLGHVVNAIYVWGVARAAGGRVLLRIEDHDRQRSRPDFERAILDDLDWLGFAPDEPPTSAFREGRCTGRQSDRTAVYDAALARLRAGGLIYACDCTRRTLGMGTGTEGERRYPGTCANKGLPDAPNVGLRVRIERSMEHFADLLQGERMQCPFDQCGDMLVRDREGNWTYQFAVTVDDDVQGVTLVIRGEDLLESTGRQVQLARLLGRAVPPMFLHHPLVMKTPAQKLSKADGDTSVRDLRASGWRAEAIIGEAAARIGLIDKARPVTIGEIPSLVVGQSG